PLTVGSIEPVEGSEAGGTKVKIKGAGFVPGATVMIGSAATEDVVVNEKEITATTEKHAPGPQEVIVEEAGLKSTGGPRFTYRAPLSVASIEPAEGPEAGGTKVKI